MKVLANDLINELELLITDIQDPSYYLAKEPREYISTIKSSVSLIEKLKRENEQLNYTKKEAEEWFLNNQDYDIIEGLTVLKNMFDTHPEVDIPCQMAVDIAVEKIKELELEKETYYFWRKIEDIPIEWKDGRELMWLLSDGTRRFGYSFTNIPYKIELITHVALPISNPTIEDK